MRGPTLQDAIALAQRMAANPADSVVLAGQLADVIAGLPPSSGELLSRPVFDRASLWSLAAIFQNVEADGEPPPQVIRCQHDVWIRGVQIQAYPKWIGDSEDVNLALQKILGNRLAFGNETTNGRYFVEANWRLDARQGFISSGQAEILAPGDLVAGDGVWQAPMDWKLQKDQTIEVRIRSRMNEIFPPLLDPETFNASDRILALVAVVFWAEELNQPSQQ